MSPPADKEKRDTNVRRRLLGIAAAAMMLLGACGGGGDDDTAAEEGVRTLDGGATDEAATEEASATKAPTEAGATEAPATEAAATEETATESASGVPGDTDGDGVLSDAELGAYANELLLSFSSCMRENGFPDFEDMTVDIFIESAGDATQSQAVFFEAMAERGVNLTDPESVQSLQACGDDLGKLQTIAPQPSDADITEREAQLLDFAQCMREQGIEDWPDPDFAANPGGGYGLELTEQFDINSPEIQTAGAACGEQGRGFFPETDG